MRFRDAIALHTCPLLLRVGLAATFLWFGIPKFDTITYTGDAAARLVNLGIGQATVVGGAPQSQEEPAVESPATKPANEAKPEDDQGGGDAAEPPAEGESSESAQPPAEQPSSETQPAQEPGEEDVAVPASEERSEPAADAPAVPEPEEQTAAERANEPLVAQPGVEYEVKAKRAENITLLLSAAHHPYPQVFAWIAVLTEVIGGGLLLVGLFSRVWGLGLAVAMGYAFALSTLPQIQNAMDPAAGNAMWQFLSALRSVNPAVQSGAFFQLMLFIAAWCIFIGGPGASSLDYLLFRTRSVDD